MADTTRQPINCSICYNNLGEPRDDGTIEAAITLPCGHLFGMKCLSHEIRQRASCPECRAPIHDDILVDLNRIRHALVNAGVSATGDVDPDGAARNASSWRDLDEAEARRDAASFNEGPRTGNTRRNGVDGIRNINFGTRLPGHRDVNPDDFTSRDGRFDRRGYDDAIRAAGGAQGLWEMRPEDGSASDLHRHRSGANIVTRVPDPYWDGRSRSPNFGQDRNYSPPRTSSRVQIIEREMDRNGNWTERRASFGDDDAPRGPGGRPGGRQALSDAAAMFRERAGCMREQEGRGRSQYPSGSTVPRSRGGRNAMHSPSPSPPPTSSRGRPQARPRHPEDSPPRRRNNNNGPYTTAQGTQIFETQRAFDNLSLGEREQAQAAYEAYRRERDGARSGGGRSRQSDLDRALNDPDYFRRGDRYLRARGNDGGSRRNDAFWEPDDLD